MNKKPDGQNGSSVKPSKLAPIEIIGVPMRFRSNIYIPEKVTNRMEGIPWLQIRAGYFVIDINCIHKFEAKGIKQV